MIMHALSTQQSARRPGHQKTLVANQLLTFAHNGSGKQSGAISLHQSQRAERIPATALQCLP